MIIDGQLWGGQANKTKKNKRSNLVETKKNQKESKQNEKKEKDK